MSRTVVASFAISLLVFGSYASGQQSVAPKAAHTHESHGPHDGELLEVGKEEYHVEIVMEESKKQLSIYLLDQSAHSFVAINAPFLSINLKVKGKPAQVKLQPVPQEIDQPGFASCFSVTSPELIDALHDSHSDARLALKIANKPYVVKVLHNHDHSGHDHSGHKHAGLENPTSKKK